MDDTCRLQESLCNGGKVHFPLGPIEHSFRDQIDGCHSRNLARTLVLDVSLVDATTELLLASFDAAKAEKLAKDVSRVAMKLPSSSVTLNCGLDPRCKGDGRVV